MKRIALFVVMLLSMMCARAQTFYELKYYDKNDEKNYTGLMIYYDDTRCTMRLVNREMVARNTYYEAEYSCDIWEKEDDDDIWMMLYTTEEEGFPNLVWSWEEDDLSDFDLSAPDIAFGLEAEDVKDWYEAKSFRELDLADLSEEYIGRFYDEDDEEYQMMVRGSRSARANRNGYGEQGWQGRDGRDGHRGNRDGHRSDREDRGGRDNRNDVGNGGNSGNNSQSSQEEEEEEILDTPIDLDGGVASLYDDPQGRLNEAGKLHLIVVANSAVSDIGQACKVDRENVRSEFKGIAKVVGLDYEETVVSDNDYNKDLVAKAISNLKPSKNDVVVFIYTGHGFRFKDQTDYYPNIDLCQTSYDDVTKNYAAMSDIYNEIVKKGARLSIVMSDCCNSQINANRPVIAMNSLFSRSNNSFDQDKLKRLFVDASGSMIATAASPGEYSWCGANGGFFLLSFIESLRSQVSIMSTTQPTWEAVIDNAIDAAGKKTESSSKCSKQNGLKKVSVR